MRYDRAKRRQAVRRKEAERGAWIYVPAVELAKAGFGPDEPLPLYRVWGTRSGGFVGRLYREP